jgi:hypothetical protein
LDQEDVFMKTDQIKPGTPNPAVGEDSQNRREFFNGLGKWSMIVVAAVSFLGRTEEAQAKKPKPHTRHENYTSWGNSPHSNYPRYNKDPGPGKLQ